MIEYRWAAPDMLELLVATRIEVLRAANRLDDAADLTEVEAQSRLYYQRALADGSHAGLLALELEDAGLLALELELEDAELLELEEADELLLDEADELLLDEAELLELSLSDGFAGLTVLP